MASSTLFAVGISGAPYLEVYNVSDWSLRTEPTILGNRRPDQVIFSPDNKWLSLFSGPMLVFDTSDWSVATGHILLSAYFSGWTSDSKYVAATTNTSPYINVFDVDSGFTLLNPVTPTPLAGVSACAFSADGTRLVVGGNGVANYYDSTDKNNIFAIAGAFDTVPTGSCSYVNFTADGNWLIYAARGASETYTYAVTSTTLTQTNQIAQEADANRLGTGLSQSTDYFAPYDNVYRNAIYNVPGLTLFGDADPTIGGSQSWAFNEDDGGESNIIASTSTFNTLGVHLWSFPGLVDLGKVVAALSSGGYSTAFNHVVGAAEVITNNLPLGRPF